VPPTLRCEERNSFDEAWGSVLAAHRAIALRRGSPLGVAVVDPGANRLVGGGHSGPGNGGNGAASRAGSQRIEASDA
jgi:hypothetical protein